MFTRPFLRGTVQFVCGLATTLLATSYGEPLGSGEWPQFRGIDAAGTVALTTAEADMLPVEWDIESGDNVRWKAPIPGLGLGSAIIYGEKIFLVTAIGEEDPGLKTGLYGNIMPVQDESEHQWVLYCLAKSTGQVIWQRTLHEGVPAIKRHTKASHANTTAATNGRYVVVLLGSEGLHCYDLDGNQVWKKDFGVLDSGFYMLPGAQWGFGSSPIIFQDLVLIQCDVQKNSFVAALDLETGEERWRVERDDVPSWGTPAVHVGSRTQMIVNGYRHSGGYDIGTGEELWRIAGGGDIPVPTPIVAKDLIVLSSAHGKESPLRAVRIDAVGEIEPDNDGAHEHLAWNKPREGVYMPTPIVYGDLLYTCRINGILTCYDLMSGDRVYRERLTGNAFTASPIAAGDKLYFASEDGKVHVVRAGKAFELLATNSMEDIVMATPSIAGGVLFVRTKDHLYAIAKPSPEPDLLAEVTTGPTATGFASNSGESVDLPAFGVPDDCVEFGHSTNWPHGNGSAFEGVATDCGVAPMWLSQQNCPQVPTCQDEFPLPVVDGTVAFGSSTETVNTPSIPIAIEECHRSDCGCSSNCECSCRRRPIRDCVRRWFRH